MKPDPSSQSKPGTPSPADRSNQRVQTGALSGGQPGEGVNTSSSAAGQSNVDAAAAQGVTYGKDERKPR